MNSIPMMMQMPTVPINHIEESYSHENADAKVMFTLPPSLKKKLDRYTLQRFKGNRSLALREAIDLLLDPNIAKTAQISDDDTAGNPLLDVTVACGAPSEAREDATIFEVSRATADELALSTDDFWVRARGESMEGRGILDEQLVLVSPLPTNRMPRRGQIALIRITDTDGEVKGTLKTWDGQHSTGLPRLKDGDGNEVTLGEVSEVVPIAVAKGILGAL
jgi:SOS-response transcriptional repressor LexA